MLTNARSNVNKYSEYEKAMNTYHNNIFYNKSGIIVSICIISLQIITLITSQLNMQACYFFYFFIAYLISDLIGGLVHMYMDNNTNYSSILGPFIAAFHLHHKVPKYKNKNILSIYFIESGTKYWLIIYLLLVAFIQINYTLPSACSFMLVCIGILSSVSEVSHYLCHNSHNKFVKLLQNYYILLPPQDHRQHHLHDNKNYAFLNGISNPLINIVASYLYDGYKNNSDLHANNYSGRNTKNR